MAAFIESEPIWCKEYSNGTDVVWYLHNIDDRLPVVTRHLLETYSNIPPDEVLPHVNKIRNKLWAIRSHMCTGRGLFLSPSMPRHSSYSTILERLKSGATLVDIGSFIGQDLRQLVVDGAPSNNMYAIDIVNHWSTGFEMYRDQDKFHAHYIEADILHPNVSFQELHGKMDIIWITHVLHQWIWEGQVIAARNLVALSRPGTVVVGYQVGADPATFQAKTELMKGDSFLHDPDSFARMWDQVGEETGTKWMAEVEFRTNIEMGWVADEMPSFRRIIHFIVERVR